MYNFTTPKDHLEIDAEDETDAVNMAEQFTNDELVSDDEMGLVIKMTEEQPELFI